MPRPKWTFSIDLDGILCEPISPDKYAQAKPIPENIKKINELYDKGFNVIIHTGRGWSLFDLTVEWLGRYGVRYTSLCMGKVVAHYYVDDRNIELDDLYHMFNKESVDGQVRTL